MEVSTILWLFVVAFGASALGGVLGMASGIFTVAILSLLFGVGIHVAIGAGRNGRRHPTPCVCGSAPVTFQRQTGGGPPAGAL